MIMIDRLSLSLSLFLVQLLTLNGTNVCRVTWLCAGRLPRWRIQSGVSLFHVKGLLHPYATSPALLLPVPPF